MEGMKGCVWLGWRHA